MYKPGAIVVLSNQLLPEFGQIIDIILYDVDHCLFVCHIFDTLSFVSHFHSFQVRDPITCIMKVIKQADLADHHPLGLSSLSSYSHSKFVPLKYHVIEK